MIGQQLGNYRILRQLGKGGMAGVYVGEHAVLGHEVAVKVLHPQFLEDERMRQRFLNEARTVARLKHPSIVEVHDFGYTDDGSGFIVMERLEGQSLRDRLEAGPIALDTALELTRQVARALQVAHAGGVVHRDLKPDNIFLVRDPETPSGERAIVLDFGLAKHVEVGGMTPAGIKAELTASGFVVGTPAYMSPEQCRGAGELDGRSDIYSLGVVLYRMSTGGLPFDADNPGEMLGQHLFVEAPSALTKRPDLPAALDTVLRRCLAKHPADRFASMDELVAALALDDSTTPKPRRDQATAAMRKPPAAASVPAPRGDDATVPASPMDVLAVAPPAPTPAPEPAPRQRSWLGPAIVIALIAAAAATTVAVWPRSPERPAPLAAAPDATPADAAHLLDATATDAGPQAFDAAVDAGPPDAPPADAAPPLSGRDLAVFVQQALNRGDRAGAFAACTRANPREEFELSACVVAACNVGEAALARRYAAGVRHAATRDRISRSCRANGIEL